MSSKKWLELTFDPNTIDDLGAKLYSQLPPILAELIANGYDAGASEVHLEFYDNAPEKTIIVRDNGVGMTFDEINLNYLIVGRKKRTQNQEYDPKYKRPVMGKKGIGKLAFFGISNRAQIVTSKGKVGTEFIMDRNEMKGQSSYRPTFKQVDTRHSGTEITLFNVRRKIGFDIKSLKQKIASYFIFDTNFKIFISYNGSKFEEISNNDRYTDLPIQFEWNLPLEKLPFRIPIKGWLFTARKPIAKKRRGIIIFSRKKLVNLPELFPIDSSSYFHEYLAGFLEADFIDEIAEDVISTDRKSLNWDHEEILDFKDWLAKIIRSLENDWREFRTKALADEIRSDPEVQKRDESIRSEQGQKDLENQIEILSGAELDADEAIDILTKTTEEFQDFHNKNLCTELSQLTIDSYKREDYYQAVFDGVKRYISKIRAKTNVNSGNDDKTVISAFKPDGGILSVCGAFTEYINNETGAVLTEDTIKTLERGNFLLAQAMLAAFRNPIAHQETVDLRESQIYTAEDCLDALSLLSHLYRRLDQAKPK